MSQKSDILDRGYYKAVKHSCHQYVSDSRSSFSVLTGTSAHIHWTVHDNQKICGVQHPTVSGMITCMIANWKFLATLINGQLQQDNDDHPTQRSQQDKVDLNGVEGIWVVEKEHS